jgi:hypothetical protein
MKTNKINWGVVYANNDAKQTNNAYTRRNIRYDVQ